MGVAPADPDAAVHLAGAGGAAAWAPLLLHQEPVAEGHLVGEGGAVAWVPLLHHRAWAVAGHPAVAEAVAAWEGQPRQPRHRWPQARAGAAHRAVEAGVGVLGRPRQAQG